MEILFLEIKMAETRQRSLIGLRNARQEQNEKIIQFLLRVSTLAHSAYAPPSLAETVVLAVFQNCVREPMKNAIRNSNTLGEALETAIRVERQHGRNRGRNRGPNNRLANYNVTSHAQLRDRAAEAEAIRVVIEPIDPTGWGPRHALPRANDAIVDEGIVSDDPDS